MHKSLERDTDLSRTKPYKTSLTFVGKPMRYLYFTEETWKQYKMVLKITFPIDDD